MGDRPVVLRVLTACLAVALVLLQARLWVSEDGLAEVRRLQREVALQREQNQRLAERNERLRAEVRDLKSGSAALEERARSDLGLIVPGETFFVVGTIPGASDD